MLSVHLYSVIDTAPAKALSLKMSQNYTPQEFQKMLDFSVIEAQPLLSWNETVIVTSLSSGFLIVGVMLNARILTLLTERNSGRAIDKLMVSNTVISIITHSVVLAYYIASHILFPMSDYIGIVGCLVSALFLDTFIRFYNFCFPVAMALLRYLFIVKNAWVRAEGMTTVTNAIISCSIMIPVLMTLSVQLPVSDQLHLAYSR